MLLLLRWGKHTGQPLCNAIGDNDNDDECISRATFHVKHAHLH